MSDARLDALDLGELAQNGGQDGHDGQNGDEGGRIQRHLSSCSACAARRAELVRARTAFLETQDIPQLAAQALARASQGSRTVASRRFLDLFPRWARLAIPAAAAAGIALAVTVARGPETGLEPTRTKGALALDPYVVHGERPGPPSLHMGGALHPGDRLALRVSGDRAGYLAIVAVDQTSEVFVYYPPGARAAPIEPGREVPLPTAVILDETLGAERIVGLRCEKPLLMADIQNAVRSAVSDAVGRGSQPTAFGSVGLPCAETRLDIVKAAPPRPR